MTTSTTEIPVVPDETLVERAFEHIRRLSEDIGGRGSCTPAERRAAEYAAGQMQQMGVTQVRLEEYQGAPSTYRPFLLAFGGALLGTLLAWRLAAPLGYWLAALLNALGAWGMLAETDLRSNWMRLFLPGAPSSNAVGVIPAAGEARQRAVLCAHLDTHRTPVFYSSRTWHKLFGLLVGAAYVSMALGALVYLLGGILGWGWVRWVGLELAAFQLFAFAMSAHADFTPFAPGANDNASGVGVALGLAQRLAAHPLPHSEVWLAFTGCEETGAHGFAAFLDTHSLRLGEDAIYIILDQVGQGELRVLRADGLVRKHPTHPRALELARRAAAALPNVGVQEMTGIAYTDALVATQRGLPALTVCSILSQGTGAAMHWHQMSDTLQHIERRSLADALAFTWQVLREVDEEVG